MDYKAIIEKAKKLGFANSLTIDEIRDYYGKEISDSIVELFSSYVRKRRNSFTLNYYGSKLTLTDKVDKDGLPIVNYVAKYSYYPEHSWFSFDDQISGQIVNTLDKLCEILQKYIDKFEVKEMVAPFTQSKEVEYANNEYPNMPSLDYAYYTKCERMRNDNKNLVDWDKVSEICKKYGFSYTIINSTFGGNDCELLIYASPYFTAQEYANWKKAKDYDKIREQYKAHKDLFLKLHDCIHELDIETRLVFDTGWAGNVGLFGSHDVHRKTYSFGDNFYDWDYITDRWSPLIHDTERKLQKGVYVYMSTYFMKKNQKNCTQS